MFSRVKMGGQKEKRAAGSFPEFGAIFMSSNSSRKACLEKRIFALPPSYANFVSQVKAGMLLFLFEYEKRELHGVFQAESDGAINIVPNAFGGDLYPAQVKFTHLWLCSPLSEYEFRDAIRENYFSAKKFKFGLSEKQVVKLLSLFSSRKMEDQAPERQLTSGQLAHSSSSSRSQPRRVVHSDRFVDSNRVISEHNVDSKFNHAFSAVRQEDPVYRDRREVDDGRYGIHQNKEYENKIEREIVRRTSEYFGDSYTATREDMNGRGLVSDRERNQRDVDADFRPVEPIRYSIEDLRSPSDVRFARSGSHETKSLLPMGHFTGNVRDAFPDARFAGSRHGFEEEHYKHNVMVPENSMEYPNVFPTNPYSSSRRVSDAESFSHFSPRQSSALVHMKEPQESNVSYATTYRDSVIKDNHSYDPDISCIRYRSPSSLGIDQYSGSLQCAPDISHASDILLSYRNQSQLSCPEMENTTIHSDVDGLARGRTLLPHSNQYEDYNAESLSRLANCDYPMIDSSENGSYDGISPLMPRQSRNNGRSSELLTSYSFDSSYPYSSVPLENHHEHKLPEFGNTADHAVDVPASYESQFLSGNHHFSQPKSADHRKETKLSPLAYQNSESLDVDCQKKKSSVFSRLALPPKVSRRENNRSFGKSDHGVESSVKEVMSSLYHSRYSWLKGSCESLISHDFGATVRDKKQVMQNSKSLKDPSVPLKESDSAATFKDKKPVMQNSKSLKEPLALSKDSDSGATVRDKKQVMVNSKLLEDSPALSKESDSGTSLKNTKQVMLNSKSLKDSSTLSKENSDQKEEGTPFVDFKRRSAVKKTLHDSTENSSKSGENDVAIGQRKRRKLVRPDFGMKGEANEILQRPSLEPFMVLEEVSSSRGEENKNSESAELLQGVVQTDQEGNHAKENKECESAELLHEASQTNHVGKRRLKTWKGSSSEGVTVEGEAPEIPQGSSLNSSIGAAKVSPSNVDKSKICEYINMLRGTDLEDNHMVDSGRLSSENISMDDNASGELQRPSPESSALKRKINLLRRTDREGKHMVDSGRLSSDSINMDGSAAGKLRRPSPESSALERNIDLHGTDCEGKYMVDSGRLSSENISVDVDASVKLHIPSESSMLKRNINLQRGPDCEGKCIVNSGRSSSENTSVDENASGELQGPSSESSILKRDITLLRGTDCEGKNVVDKGSLASENNSMDENASGEIKRPSPEPSALKRKIKLLRGTNREGKNMDGKGSVTSENISMDENASGKLKRTSPEPTALKRKIKLLRGTNREGKNMVDKGNLTSESISANDDASRKLQRPSSESSLLKRKTADFNASDSRVNANNICQSEGMLDVGCQKDVSLEEGEIGSFERDSEEDRKESYERDESSDVSFKESGAKIDKGRSTAKDSISGGLCEGEDNASHLGVQNHSRKVTRDTARNLHKRFKTALNR